MGRASGDLVVFGMDSGTGALLAPPLGLDQAAKALRDEGVAPLFAPTALVDRTYGVIEGADPYDPREVGWVAVVGRDDPTKTALTSALRPLAETRGSPTSWGPLEYPPGADLGAWIRTTFYTLDPAPRFVVLAGSPSHLPFALQTALACLAFVGRLDFSTVAGGVETQHPELFEQYVDKLLRNEAGQIAPTDNDVLVWAPSGSRDNPVFYSRHLMAAPLADRIAKKGKYRVTCLFDGDATAAALAGAVATARPALLFTASHGEAARLTDGVDVQAARNGALVGQDTVRFTAADLPAPSEPFVEGGVVFQFACFGFGTPATSGFTHWWPKIAPYQAPFELVSALPKAALAHPRGPIGYIAHADYAVLHAFADAERPGSDGTGALAPRLAPFRSSVDEALRAVPVGAVLDPMAGQLSLLNFQLADVLDRARAGGAAPEVDDELVDSFLRRNDARYYLLLGDPAARPRIDDGHGN